MTNTFKKLAQGQLPASAGVLYTVPSLTQAIVKTIVLSNTSGSAQTVTVYVDGIGASNNIGNLTIPTGGTATWSSNGWSVKDATGATITTSTVTISGDASGSGSGSIPLTLATVNPNTGAWGDASHVPQITLDGKGRALAASSVSIVILPAAVTGFDTQVRTSRLDQMSAPTADVSLGSHKLTNVLDPTGPQDAATKAYVDATAQGLAVKGSVDYATTASLPTYTYANGTSGVGATIIEVGNGALPAIDGVSPQLGDDFLVKNETAGNAPYNGIYVITSLGSVGAPFVLTRRNDADTGTDISGAFVFIEAGTQNVAAGFTLPAQTVTMGTTALNWVQFSGAGEVLPGNSMTKTGNVLDVVTTPATQTAVGATRTLTAGTGLTGGGNLSADRSFALADMAQATFKMRAAAAGTGAPIDGTPTQAKVALAIANTDVSGLGTLSTQSGTFSGTSSGTNTGDVTLAAVGAVPNANAASLSGQALTLQPASASFPGVVTAAQFVILSNTSGTNTGNASLTAVGASPNANGATLTGQALNLELASASFPGLATAAQFTKLSNLSGTNTGDQTITLTGAVTGSGTGSFATTAATATANTIKANATSSTATPTDVALTANQFLARSSSGDIAAKTVTDTGLSWLILTSIAAQTAALNAATAAVQGMMSAQDKIRMGAQFDAQADLGFVGDLITTNSTSSCSTGTPNQITDTANPFTPFANTNYYVGKRITLAGAGASGAVYVGTITAVAAGTATVTPNISTTVTNRICSFGTDNTTAVGNLNTLVNTTNALFPGIRINFGQSATNAYGFPVPVSVNKTMQIEGVGSGYTADTGDYTRLGGTRLAWWGTSVDGGVAFGAFWTISPTGVQSIKRPAFRHCWLDCRNGDQNSALIGLKMASCQGWSLDEFFVMDPGAIGIWLDIATSPTEARDCTRGFATNLGFRCLDNTSGPAAVTLTPTTTSTAVSIASSTSLTLAAANGLRASGSDYIWVQSAAGRPFLARYTGGGGTTTLTGVVCSAEDAVHVPTTVSGSNVVQASPGNSCAIYLNGGSGANTCCNTFLQTAISHGGSWGPAAVDFGNSDSNNFQSCYINGGTRAVFGAAPNNRMTKPGVRFNGSNVANTLAARNNTFTGGDPGSLPTTNGGVECMGLTNAGALLVAPSGPNIWESYQLGNGAPMPVVEQGASFFWTNNGGFREGGLNSLTANQALTAAVANVVNGCWVVVPPQGWQVGTRHRWEVYLSKTAVGAAFTVNVRQHSSLTAGGGTLIATVAFTGTGVIDEGFVQVDLMCNTLGGSGTALARYRASHNLATAAGLFTGAAAPVTSPNPVTALQTFEGVMTMAAFNTAAPSGGPTFLFLEIVPTTAATVMTVLPPSGLTCLKHANP